MAGNETAEIQQNGRTKRNEEKKRQVAGAENGRQDQYEQTINADPETKAGVQGAVQVSRNGSRTNETQKTAGNGRAGTKRNQVYNETAGKIC